MHKVVQPSVQHIAQKIVPPALLGWQYVLLAFFCGLGAGRYLSIFLFPLFFLLFLTITSQKQRSIRCLALCIFFAIGLWWMHIHTPTPPPVPAWLSAHFAESSRTPGRSPGILVTGTVIDATPRPDNRMNIILKDVVPTKIPDAPMYKGYVIWSGEQPNTYPHKGQRLHGFLILSPEHGFANKHTWNLEQSRNDQGIWLRARTKAHHTITFSGQGSLLSRIRTQLYFSFLQALPQEPAQHNEVIDSFTKEQSRKGSLASQQKGYIFSIGKNQEKSSLSEQKGYVEKNHQAQQKQQVEDPKGYTLSNATKEVYLAQPTRVFSSFPVQPALTSGASLLPALIFGDRSFIDPVVTERINKSTLAHSLSLSGLHLGYALMVAFAVTYILTLIFPTLMLYLPRPYLTLLLGLPCTLLYMWLGAAPLSLQRAFFMYFCAGLLFCLRKPAVLLDGLLLALLIIFIARPLYLFDISLQLSALSIAAMAWFLPLGHTMVQALFTRQTKRTQKQNHPFTVTQRIQNLSKKFAKAIVYMFFTSCCIQLALIPLLLKTFGTAGLWLPLNILWLPILGAIVMPFAFMGLLFTSLSLPLFAKTCVYLASLPCDWLLWLLEYMDTQRILIAPLMPRPHWLFITGFWLICLALPFLIQKIWLMATPIFANKKAFRKNGQHLIKGIKKYSLHRQIYQQISPKKLHAQLAHQPHCQQHAELLHQPSCQQHAEQNSQWYRQLCNQCRTGIVKACNSTPCIALATGFLFCLLGIYVPQWQQPKGVSIDVFDVGAAQSIAVSWNTPSGKGRALIDGGNLYDGGFDTGKYIITPALTYATSPKLTYVINSHADSDHLGGLVYIVNNFGVQYIIKSNDTASTWLQKQWETALKNTQKTAHIASAGQTIYLTPDLYFEVLWPESNKQSKNTLNNTTKTIAHPVNTPTSTLRNSQSLLLRLVWQGKPLALLCGDLGTKDLNFIAKMPTSLHAPILVLPHHGSFSSYSASFYQKVQPLFAIASCRFTSNGKPLHEKVTQSLEQLHVQLFTTALQGQTTFTFVHPQKLPIITTVRHQ